ncbi:MAG: hypothetical protein IBX41_08740 [Methanophagales archaeon]|nr:hypothetical protein [Methanophagales archaeon]
MERRELEERMTRLEKNFEDYNIYWRERVAYISIIVGLIVALIMTWITLIK